MQSLYSIKSSDVEHHHQAVPGMSSKLYLVPVLTCGTGDGEMQSECGLRTLMLWNDYLAVPGVCFDCLTGDSRQWGGSGQSAALER